MPDLAIRVNMAREMERPSRSRPPARGGNSARACGLAPAGRATTPQGPPKSRHLLPEARGRPAADWKAHAQAPRRRPRQSPPRGRRGPSAPREDRPFGRPLCNPADRPAWVWRKERQGGRAALLAVRWRGRLPICRQG